MYTHVNNKCMRKTGKFFSLQNAMHYNQTENSKTLKMVQPTKVDNS